MYKLYVNQRGISKFKVKMHRAGDLISASSDRKLEEIRNLFYEDAKERINVEVTKPKTSIQWIPLEKTLEEEVWELF